MSNVQYRISNVEDRISNVEYRISNVEYRISNVQYRISNVEYRIWNDGRMSHMESLKALLRRSEKEKEEGLAGSRRAREGGEPGRKKGRLL